MFAADTIGGNSGSPVVNTDHLADGTEMRGVDGLKKWLLSREDEFTSNFHRKLLGYALGRAVLPGDKRLLERMKQHKTHSSAISADGTPPGSNSYSPFIRSCLMLS